MSKTTGALTLSPDGYSRFFVIVNLLEALYKNKKQQIRILDVGGCSPYLGEMLRHSKLDTELTVLDILPKPANLKTKYIQADATTVDLPDGAYDVVVSTDTLEHITPKGKEAFVKACTRLAGGVFILAAPFSTEGVHEAEVMVNDFNKKLFGMGQDWLEEHFEYKKPDLEFTRDILDKLKVSYTDFGTNNLYSWLFSAHLNLIEAKLGLDAATTRRIKHHYNLSMAYSPEFQEPTYRHFFVAYKNKKMSKLNLPAYIIEHTEPETFMQYIHEMLGEVADRIDELMRESAKTRRELQVCKAELDNRQKIIEEQQAVLKKFEPLRRIAHLRHPSHLVKVVKKRITGK